MTHTGQSVAVVGLGAMGSAMARNLLAAGHDVAVWNRSPTPVEQLVAQGARAALSASDAFESGVVLSALSDDDAVAETFLHPRALAASRNALHVNLATVSPALAALAADAHAEHGCGYVSAPVFGSVAVASAGQLQVLAAGPSAHIDQAQPFLDVIGARTWRLGDSPHQASVVKILGNFLIASAIQALSEAVSMGERSDVPADLLVEILAGTIFPGRVYSGYGSLIADRSYRPAGFTTALGRKDIGLALDLAATAGLRLPFGEVLRSVYDDALSEGLADWDWSSVAELQRNRHAG
ncbi:MAG: NAD(P)-dependent oxidoreductase [Segniliparus sp.]|uniref:NAD(P)-dependent oxidoreductase n=1 Tax=Segniliparus sp. TaxID=2804064 RepID=UPI003F2C1225